MVLEAQLAEARAGQNFKSLLSVQTTPEDATITLKDGSGQVVGRKTGSPFAESLMKASTSSEVEHPKYKTIATPITIAAGKVYMIITEMSQGQFLGFLRVVTNVPGANVYVDKKEEGALGKTPSKTPRPPGSTRVWVEKPGYKPVERNIEIGVGDDVLLKLEIERVDYGRVRVVANKPDALVYIDGKLVGGVPLERDHRSGRTRDPRDRGRHEDVAGEGQCRARPGDSRARALATSRGSRGRLGHRREWQRPCWAAPSPRAWWGTSSRNSSRDGSQEQRPLHQRRPHHARQDPLHLVRRRLRPGRCLRGPRYLLLPARSAAGLGGKARAARLELRARARAGPRGAATFT